ncbi:hypothetical protein GF327_09160 [Candidatus Woesearchaeota archaeon]|nr:hypothetical protein [Candidatus Woesearchaeota archaeon]
MSISPDSKLYFFYIQSTKEKADKDRLFKVIKKFKVKVPKYNIHHNYFWLCIDSHPSVAIRNFVTEIKNEFNIESDEFVQTVSDFDHIDKIMEQVKDILI